MADILLTEVNAGTSESYSDISFTNGDFTLTRGLVTAMMMSIFCEVRDDSIDIPQKRGGWAGNQLQPVEGYEQGSLIWTKYQSAATEEIANECQQYIEDGFNWMIQDGIAKDVDVETNIVANNKLSVKISITRNDDTQDVSFYDLWLATINNT